MTGPVVQSHGPDGIVLDEKELTLLEQSHDLCFGKESWRYPAMQQMRMESLARSTLMLVREIRSLRKQLDAKKERQ